MTGIGRRRPGELPCAPAAPATPPMHQEDQRREQELDADDLVIFGEDVLAEEARARDARACAACVACAGAGALIVLGLYHGPAVASRRRGCSCCSPVFSRRPGAGARRAVTRSSAPSPTLGTPSVVCTCPARACRSGRSRTARRRQLVLAGLGRLEPHLDLAAGHRVLLHAGTWGTKKLWMTSLDVRWTCTTLFDGHVQVVVEHLVVGGARTCRRAPGRAPPS